MIGAIVETGVLAKVVLYSLLIGVGISLIFAVGVSSVAELLEALRERRTAAGAAWGVASAACLILTLAAVVLGILVMSSKS